MTPRPAKKKAALIITPTRLLAAIECIAEHALDMKDSPEQKALGDIYRFAHIAFRCQHKDWDAKFRRAYRGMVKSNLIPDDLL